MVVVLLLAGLLIVGVWWHFKLKGRRIARAYTYLMILERDGATIDGSHRVALSIDMFAANQLKPRTMLHVNEVFKGSHLALITEARSQGFRG